MAKIGNPFTTANLVVMVMVAVAGIYLYGRFTVPNTPCTAEQMATTGDHAGEHGCSATHTTYTSFKIPSGETNSIGLWLMRLLIIGTALFIALTVVTKVSVGSLNRRQVLTLIILGVAIYFVWTYIASPIMKAPTLDDIAFKTALKLGLATP